MKATINNEPITIITKCNKFGSFCWNNKLPPVIITTIKKINSIAEMYFELTISLRVNGNELSNICAGRFSSVENIFSVNAKENNRPSGKIEGEFI